MLKFIKHFLLEEAGHGAGGGGTGGAGAPAAGGAGAGDAAPLLGAPAAGAPPPKVDAGQAAGGAGAPAPTPPPAVTFPENWREGLPADVKDEASLKLISDIPTLAKSYLNAQKLVGADKIPLPGKHASDEDWRGVYQKLGLPKDLKDYTLEVPKDSILQKEGIDGFKEAAFKAGILPKQAQGLVGWFEQGLKTGGQKALDDAKAQTATEVKALKQEWGMAYTQKLESANAALKEFADPGLLEYLKKSGMENNVHLTRLLAKIGDATREDQIKGQGGQLNAKTPPEAMAEYKKIVNDMAHPYYNAKHPNHNQAVSDVAELFSQAHPQEGAPVEVLTGRR